MRSIQITISLVGMCGLLFAQSFTNEPNRRIATAQIPSVSVGGQFLLNNDLQEERVKLRKRLMDLELNLDEEQRRAQNLRTQLDAQQGELKKVAAAAATANILEAELAQTRELMTKQQYALQDEENRFIARERKLQSQLEQTTVERDALAKDLDARTRELQQLTAQVTQQETTLQTMTMARSDLGDQLDQAKKAIADMRTRDAQLQGEMKGKAELEMLLREKELALADLDSQLRAQQRAKTVMHENMLADQELLVKTVQAKEGEIANNLIVVKQLQDQVAMLSKTQDDLQASVRDTKAKLDAGTLEKKEIDQKLADAIKLQDTLELKEKALAARDLALSQSNAKVQDLETQIAEEKARFDKKVATHDASVSKLLAEVRDLRKRMIASNDEMIAAKTLMQQSETNSLVASKLKEEIEAAELKEKALSTQLGAKDQEIASIRNQLDLERGRLTDALQSRSLIDKELSEMDDKLMVEQTKVLELDNELKKFDSVRADMDLLEEKLELANRQIARQKDDLERQAMTLTGDRDTWKARADSRQALLEESDAKRKHLEKTTITDAEELSALKAERLSLRDKVSSLQKQVADQSRQLTTRAKMLEDLDAAVDDASTTLDSLDGLQPGKNMNSGISRLSEDLAAAEAAATGLRKKNMELETQVQRLESDLKREENLRMLAEKKSATPSNTPKETKGLLAQITELEKEKADAQREITTVKTDLQAARDASARQMREVNDLTARIKTLEGQIANMPAPAAPKTATPQEVAAAESLKAQVNRMKMTLDARQTQIDSLSAKLTSSRNELSAMKATQTSTNDLAAASKTLDAANAENQKLQAEVKQLKSQIAANPGSPKILQARMDSLSRDLGKRSADLDDAKQKITAMSAQLQSKDAKLKTTTADLAAARTMSSQTNSAAVTQLQAQITGLKADLDARTKDAVKQKAELDTALAELASWKEKADKPDPMVATLSTQMDEMKAQLQQREELTSMLQQGLAAANKEVDRWKTTAEGSQPKVAALKKQVSDLEALITQRNKQAEDLQASIASANRKIEALTKDVQTMAKAPATPKPDPRLVELETSVKEMEGQVADRDKQLTELSKKAAAAEAEAATWKQKASAPSPQMQAARQRAEGLAKDLAAVSSAKKELEDLLRDRELEMAELRRAMNASASTPAPPAASGIAAKAPVDPSIGKTAVMTPKTADATSSLPLAETSPVPAAPSNNAPAPATEPVGEADYYDMTALGHRLLKEGKVEDARAEFQRAITTYPELVGARLGLASVYLAENDISNARSAVNSVLIKDSSHPQALGIRSLLLWQEGKYAEADNSIKSAIRRARNSAQLHNYQGIIAHSMGNLEEAEVALTEAVGIDDDLGEAHFNLAVLKTKTTPARIDEARLHYEKALNLLSPRDLKLEKILYQ